MTEVENQVETAEQAAPAIEGETTENQGNDSATVTGSESEESGSSGLTETEE